jgi:hypothetical protein
MPVVILTGMRQAGKTTFLRNQPGLEGRRFVTLDDFAELRAAQADPERFIASDQPLTIDEAHKCPDLLNVIKMAVDRKRTPGRFLLSGSANLLLLKGVSESLAGRAVYLPLHPFNRRETGGRTDRRPYIMEFFHKAELPPQTKAPQPISPQEVLAGGMPIVCLGGVQDHALWFRGYEQTYLERDIRDIAQVENLMALRGLLRLGALRTGQLFNLSHFGRDVKLSALTTSRYLSLLEASFVVYRLAPYLRNRSSRLIKSPKLYQTDAGLAAYLAEFHISDRLALGDPLYGALFETYIAQNLLAIIEAQWPRARLYFWGVHGRHEVDFVVEAERECLAVEVKASSRWDERDLAGLKAFLAATPNCKAAVLGYNGTEAVALGDRLWAVPLALLLE